MRVTVGQMECTPDRFARDWERLVQHVRAERSELVLLPELTFSPWFATTPQVDLEVWRRALAEHDRWGERLRELEPAVVVGTRPVSAGERRLNQGYVYGSRGGLRLGHSKYLLPEEDGFYEASWFSRGDGDFSLMDAGPARLGFAICTELWFLERSRRYGRDGAHLVVTPRATEASSVDNWLLAGRVAAIVSGAYSLSSNRTGGSSPTFGGRGWLIAPSGEVLATTSAERPFVTAEIDLAQAEHAKKTYPRYVVE